MDKKDGAEKKKSITRTDLFTKGSVIAAFITLPSLASFFVAWNLSGEVLQSAVIGLVVHFVTMGFAMKLSKKLFSPKVKGQDDKQ